MIKIQNWIIRRSEIVRIYCDSDDYEISIDTEKESDKYQFYFESKWSFYWQVIKLRIKLFVI